MATQPNANYTNISDIKDFWLRLIGPNYFDFSDTELYNSGIFGYVNEVMGNTTEDAFNAINIARREFYPVTAQYTSSLYKMATLQGIDIPMVTPAHCKAALIIPQSQIIENSTSSGDGTYECTIDSCLKIFADNLQFMLDYPIKIISKYNEKWTHIVHYDVSTVNSLSSDSTERYLSNKIVQEDGINYMIIFVDAIRQIEMEQVSQVIIRDSAIQTTTMDVDFDGDLANFEVFYVANSGDAEVQLKKVMINGAVPNVPFVFYEYVNEHRIRLTFKYNSVFVPQYNSEIICRIYTSSGASGNFSSFDGDLVCSSDSEDYPYNSTMTILGKVNGSSFGGADRPSLATLRNKVIQAYSTNSTITTSSDLQIKFDEVSDKLSNVRTLFKKKRDDPFIRLFGAYSLLKTTGGDIIPTATLSMEALRNAISDPGVSAGRIVIKPGGLFTYKSESSHRIVPILNSNGKIESIINLSDVTNDGFVFTNPFLIGINVNPNIIGYYLNTVDSTSALNYTKINDDSPMQFITSGFKVHRNGVLGHNYYKMSVKLVPATDLDVSTIVELPNTEADDYEIRAMYNGIVKSSKYVYDNNMRRGYVETTIEYTDLDVDDPIRLVKIQSSSTPVLDPSFIGIGSVTQDTQVYRTTDLNYVGKGVANSTVSIYEAISTASNQVAQVMGTTELKLYVDEVADGSTWYKAKATIGAKTFTGYVYASDITVTLEDLTIGTIPRDSTFEVHVDNSADGETWYKVRYVNGNTTLVGYVDSLRIAVSDAISGGSTAGYRMNFEVGETFVANDVLATKMLTDKGNLHIVADIGKVLFDNGYYLPFVVEDYDENLGAYTLNAYLATDDEISLDGQIVFTYGVYDMSGNPRTYCPLKMKDQTIELNVLFNNDGTNLNHRYSSFTGLNNYTLTNSYETVEDESIYFVEDLQYVRSTVDYTTGEPVYDEDGETVIYDETTNYKFVFDEVPVLQASWALDASQIEDFIRSYKTLDGIMQDIFYDLENNFSIDTKFYTTYGKSRFYTVGNNSESMVQLDNVRISMRFGVKMNTNFSVETFVSSFRNYVKNYIENVDTVGIASQDIYIMNLISELKAQFGEIEYIEYYGFNGYDYMAQKIIGPDLDEYIDGYIPEFINIDVQTVNGFEIPAIQVDILS